MHKRIQIKNATIVNEGRQFVGSLLIDNNQIGQILEGHDAVPDEPPMEIVDAEGCFLLPGVIDEHVHFREPGLTEKADFETESFAAAAGGVTTVFDMPNTLPTTTTVEAFNEKLDMASAKSHVNFGLYLGATRDNYQLLSHLNPRLIAGIKLFMGASTGNMLVDDETALRGIFENAPTLLMVHCEDTPTISANMNAYKEQYGNDPDIRFYGAIRSAEACLKSTAQAVVLAREYGTRLHVAHVSTARELDLFSANDKQITAEACVPHLLFCDEDYARLGSRIKCNPSIKTRADRDALRQALTDGTIATIATDHAPHHLRDKVGGAAQAVSGMPMVQFSLVAMLELVDEGVLPIERLVELMCHNPAAIFQVENRGFLREGYKADLVLLRPNSPWTLTPNQIRSKCNWSPLEGHTFHWRIEKTYCNGDLIYNKGHLVDENIHGLPVSFSR